MRLALLRDMHRSTIQLSGLRIDRVTQDSALDAIAHLVAAQRGGFVVTPNLDHVAIAKRDDLLRAAYEDAALSLADGQPLVWCSRLLGTPLPERVAGADLLAPLFKRAESAGWRVFLLGGREDVSRRAKRLLRARHPRLQVVGRDSSFWSPQSTTAPADERTVWAVRRARPDLVIVAYGCPKQERWMHRHAALLGPAVCLGLGGSLDFYVGAVRRAPSWVSRIGAEWIYRLAQEPRRLATRYLWRDPQVVPGLLIDALLQRLGMGPAVSLRGSARPTDLIPGLAQSRGHVAPGSR
jgi:N-acetylglucosaminyldiphosphoundecaprenol N-acetyl-beta-D-mannosaminyltransferase